MLAGVRVKARGCMHEWSHVACRPGQNQASRVSIHRRFMPLIRNLGQLCVHRHSRSCRQSGRRGSASLLQGWVEHDSSAWCNCGCTLLTWVLKGIGWKSNLAWGSECIQVRQGSRCQLWSARRNENIVDNWENQERGLIRRLCTATSSRLSNSCNVRSTTSFILLTG